jgi:hypothetical protein
VTVGIIACVVPTTPGSTTSTTTLGTTPASTTTGAAPAAPVATAPPAPTSGTTVTPTSVATTSGCQKDMATVGGQYVSGVSYGTLNPVTGTSNTDLTNPTSNGITFPQQPAISGLVDQNNQPLYTIDIKFNAPGVNSLGSVAVKPTTDSNVKSFAVEFFVESAPNQPVTLSSFTDKPLVYNSVPTTGQPVIDTFPSSQVPSPLIGIRFIVLSTSDTL